MTKSLGIGRGGRRAGGRPKGSKNKNSRPVFKRAARVVVAEILPQLKESDRELPLFRILRRIGDENLDERYRDALAIAAMPFMHPRPRSDLTAKAFFQMSSAELDAVEKAQAEHEREIAKGRGHLRLIEKG